jgi:SulP family sulfate permease
VPRGFPLPDWPWRFHAPDDPPLAVDWSSAQDLVIAGFAIAMLGAIESLLSAVVADGMTGQEHDPNGELLGQGVANLAVPFFGGFAATGAIARTSANIRFGARSPVAAVVHAVFILLAMLLLAPLLGLLPMAAMAALLLRVAWNMSEARHFILTVRRAPRSDVAVLLVCFSLTVVVDMVVAVFVGIVLSSLLFMQRMAAIGGGRIVAEHHHAISEAAHPGLLVYEVAGPLFFGAAHRAMSQLRDIGADARAVVMDLSAVPVMDATGLFNLGSAVDRLTSRGVFVVLAGVQPQPLRVMAKGHFHRDRHYVTVCASLDEGMGTAAAMVQLIDPSVAPVSD